MKRFFNLMFCVHCFCLSVAAQYIDTNSVVFPILPYHEFSLNLKEEFKHDLRQELIMNTSKNNKSISLNFPFKYELNNGVVLQHNLNLNEILLQPSPVYYIGDNSIFQMNQPQDITPSLSSICNVCVGFKIQATENWSIDISSSAYKYKDFSGIYNDFSINASSYIPVSENFGVNVYGSYALNAINNANAGSVPYSPFAPSSYYGGSVEYKISDKFGIEAGMLRQYNPWKRKWENVYFAAPKFYK